jgi:hypothetical protein
MISMDKTGELERKTEIAILDTVGQRELTPQDLIKELANRGTPNEFAIRTAIWSLISRNLLQLTEDQRLKK